MILPPSLSIREGHLCVGGEDCNGLTERFGTPLYVTDGDRVLANYYAYSTALSSRYTQVRVLYAAKANGNLAILRMLGKAGAGADVFSSGELQLALSAGMLPEDLLFNGNSKNAADLTLAVQKGVKVSVDSLDELALLDSVAEAEGKTAEIAFRVNPAIEVPTHPKIATGLRTSKFGIPHEQILSAYQAALSCEHIQPVGLHCHIGSQILDMEPFVQEAEVIVDLAGKLVDLGVPLQFIDLGGGLGIPYRHATDPAPTPEDYAARVLPVFLQGIKEAGIRPAFWVEPGRYLVADSTVLLTRVNSVKEAYCRFVNVDAGFNLLVRPAMYDAYHEVVVANRADVPPLNMCTIAGPICESGDILARDRYLPVVRAGDLVAILDTGAYGFAMSSQYNARPRCAEVLIAGKTVSAMRRAETVEDLIAPMEDCTR
ncbi:MAG: diaminopimelate decarboxylase [Methanomicrobiales archaeon]|nr:diaminopimelate decarboxylase [Methanomicrobiales archaeon]